MRDPGVLAAIRIPRAARVCGESAGFVLAVFIGLLAGDGWLYVLRGAGWFASGPNVGDSLPLLQLAGFDGQPLLRVVVAWLLAGVLVGVVTVRIPALRRGAAGGSLALVLLLLASQASYALARNLRFGAVVFSRAPGSGPWLEALAFAIGCALPRRLVPRPDRRRVRRPALSVTLFGAGHRGLSGGQSWDASEHDGDRAEVGDDRERVRAQGLSERDHSAG